MALACSCVGVLVSCLDRCYTTFTALCHEIVIDKLRANEARDTPETHQRCTRHLPMIWRRCDVAGELWRGRLWRHFRRFLKRRRVMLGSWSLVWPRGANRTYDRWVVARINAKWRPWMTFYLWKLVQAQRNGVKWDPFCYAQTTFLSSIFGETRKSNRFHD